MPTHGHNLDSQPARLGPGRRRVLAALVAACGLAVAACGGSGSSAGTTVQAVAPASTTAVAQTTTAAQKPSVHAKPRLKTKTPTDPRKPKATKPDAATVRATRVPARKATIAAPLSAATPAQSKMVLACLTRAKLAPVSAASRALWSGYTTKTGTFVYVERYQTSADVSADMRSLGRESAATAGLYVVSQPITRYRGSPVFVVAACLGGTSTTTGGSNPGSGKKKKKGFTF